MLYPYLALALTVMVTVFHHRRWLKKYDDFKASLLYFTSFFLLLMAIPGVAVLVLHRNPSGFFHDVGFSVGNSRLGLLLAAAAIPVALLSVLVSRRDPAMRQQYPFSKSACRSSTYFFLFETAYLFLYYLPWEFVFRGMLFFPLVAAIGLVPALAVQALLSTLYHIGHPDTEIFAALAAGFIFGLIAYHTRSILYTTAIHATIGIFTDVSFYRRYHRKKA